MKYLIIGLGNPGPEYSKTRHNIGFMVLDAFAEASNTVFQDKRYASRADVKFKGRNLILLKPNTFMNLSGNAVRYWMKKEKTDIEKVLVILDDIALDFGKMRIRTKGGDAGHNGLSHIIQILNTNQFNRMRIGIGNDFPKGQQINYVLENLTDSQIEIFNNNKDNYIEAIKSFSTIGVERTMNFFNKK